MEIRKGISGHPRVAQVERHAQVAIQHPGGNGNDFARPHDDARDSAVRPRLETLALNTTLEIRMPPIPHDDFASEMGRMSARWELEERIGYLPFPRPAPRPWRAP